MSFIDLHIPKVRFARLLSEVQHLISHTKKIAALVYISCTLSFWPISTHTLETTHIRSWLYPPVSGPQYPHTQKRLLCHICREVTHDKQKWEIITTCQVTELGNANSTVNWVFIHNLPNSWISLVQPLYRSGAILQVSDMWGWFRSLRAYWVRAAFWRCIRVLNDCSPYKVHTCFSTFLTLPLFCYAPALPNLAIRWSCGLRVR